MTSQYGAYALRAGLARLYARIRMHKPTRPGTHMHACTRKHEHTDKYVIFIAFLQQQWFPERALMLCYTCIVCLVSVEQDTQQCTYNITLKGVQETTAVMGRNQYYIFVCERACGCGYTSAGMYLLTYPACNAHAPYCHLRPLCLQCFSTLSHTRHDFRKNSLNVKCVF